MAAILAICFGGLGVHRFYVRQPYVAAVWLILCIVFSWTIVAPIFLAVVGICDGVSYLITPKDAWEKRFAK